MGILAGEILAGLKCKILPGDFSGDIVDLATIGGQLLVSTILAGTWRGYSGFW